MKDDGVRTESDDQEKVSTPCIELKLLLECPGCASTGRVALERLAHLFKCRKCGTSFWLGVDGRVQSDLDSPRVRIVCPRCGEVRESSEVLPTRKFQCNACQLEIVLPRRKVRAESHSPDDKWAKAVDGKVLPRKFDRRAVLLAALACGLAFACGWWFLNLPDQKLLQAAGMLNFTLLDGDETAALEWVEEGQDKEFLRWVKVEYEQAKGTDSDVGVPRMSLSARWLSAGCALVEIEIYGMRKRVIRWTQIWRRGPDDKWRFDPLETRKQADVLWARKMKEREVY